MSGEISIGCSCIAKAVRRCRMEGPPPPKMSIARKYTTGYVSAKRMSRAATGPQLACRLSQ
jgi:hypothetical protein